MDYLCSTFILLGIFLILLSTSTNIYIELNLQFYNLIYSMALDNITAMRSCVVYKYRMKPWSVHESIDSSKES